MIPHGPDFLHFAKGTYVHDLLHYYYSLLAAGYQIGDDIVLKSIQERVKTDREAAEEIAEETGREIDYTFFADCTRTIINFVTKRSPIIDTGISQLQIENHLEWEHDGRNFHGFVDLIYKKKGKWYVRDHKTGSRNVYSDKNAYTNTQLLFYGTLFYKLTGKVPLVEISYLHSSPPKNPKKTELWGTYTVEHSASEYEGFWNYIMEVHERQKLLKPLRNLSACGNCRYFNICSFQLKNLDASLIVRANYEHKQENPSEIETAGGNIAVETGNTFNFGGGNY